MSETVPTLVPVKGAGMAIRHKKPDNGKSSERVKSVVAPPPPLVDFDAEEENQTYTGSQKFTISPENIAKFENTIQKANRRLERGGVEERFEYTMDVRYLQNGDGTYREEVTATLTKPVISHNGWQFAGAHEFTPNGSVVTYWAGEQDGAEAPTEPVCDQCGIKRHRERVYTVRNGDETKRVGSSCMNLFLGVTPEGLWTLNGKLEDELDSYATGSLGAMRSYNYDTRTLVAAALALSSDGAEFVSQTKATKLNPSTASKVSLAIPGDVKFDPSSQKVTDVIDFVRSMKGDSDYEMNLKEIFAPSKEGLPEMVKAKHLAFAVSAVGAYHRAQNKVVREKAAAAFHKDEYIGVKGEKYEPKGKLTVEKRMSFEGDYGTITMLLMRDEEGRLIKWNASNPPDVWEGGTVDAKKFTIKDHAPYEGKKQTVITRPSLNESKDLGRAPTWKLEEIVREEFENVLMEGANYFERNPDFAKKWEEYAALEKPEDIKAYFAALGYNLTVNES